MGKAEVDWLIPARYGNRLHGEQVTDFIVYPDIRGRIGFAVAPDRCLINIDHMV
ncbi:hypothetical protein D3C75_1370930 [compost metagenome]